MIQNTRWSNIHTSFQFKLLSIFTLLTFLISCLLSTLYIVSESKEARRHANEILQLRAIQLADSIRLPLYAENSDMLRQLAEQASKTPEINTVVIIAPDGRLLANIHNTDHSDSSENISQTVEVQSNHLVDSLESSMTGGRDTTVSILGSVRLEQSTAKLTTAIHQMITASMSIAIAFWLAVSLLCHLVLKRVTNSFNMLVQGINAIEMGDLNYRIDIISNDEPCRAAVAVNNLAGVLQQRNKENIILLEERLHLERQMLQAQKLESMGVMAGGIAHDFNNLLQSILGNIELALMKLDPESTPHKYIANAVNSAKRGALLTSLMLTYIGKGLITKKKLNLNELVKDNVDILKIAATSAVSLELCLQDELPVIMADEASIQQVVMNLITNAGESIKKELPGFIKLTTGVQDCDQAFLAASLIDDKPGAGHFVFLEVTDNGCGMSDEIMRRLFDPFFTTKFTGRGLGMSAVLGIIKTHNGALFVESKPGKGTTFRVLFPVLEVELPATAHEPITPNAETAAAAENTLSGLALVVDDERSVLKVCTKMVKLCGFTVITACDGSDAVAKFREHADDIVVVLMDLTMPNMDGITAMSEIYSIRPGAKVILSSGFNEDELSERITSQPPSGFIRKPYSMNVLETEMKRVMQAA